MIAHLALLGAVLLAPPNDGNGRTLRALRVTAAHGAPTVDGRLDDAVWAASDSISDFIQTEPNEGEVACFRTVGRIAFDAQAIYVAIRAYDSEPDKIMAQLTRRDQESASDWLYVGFDSHHDLRTAYIFGVNPAGVKQDAFAADGAPLDLTWNAVWDVATQRDEQGWTAEFRIPLSALRFAADGDGVWGLQMTRLVQRTRELSRWGPTPQDEPRRVARFGTLHGLTDLPAPRRLEILPYTVSSMTRAPGDLGNPFYASTDWTATAGLDMKYGVTSDLTLDLTVNPDFGQVEADPSQVNLSAYETFFPEQRPFFTEGADIFRFGIALGDGDDANEKLFYSRRIGRAPQRSVNAPADGYIETPGQTTILGAAKLSGRVPGGWSVGMLNALTGEERAHVSDGFGVRAEEAVEPLTNYSVLRARRAMNQGRTQVGGVVTGVVRSLDDSDLEFLRSSAFAGGVDLSHRWKQDEWLASAFLLGSRINGSTDAIIRAQRSSARYFQRPDADHVDVDSAATSMSGWAANYQVVKIAGGHWRGGLLGQVRSPGFEVNDLGYQRDADQITNAGFLGYRDMTPGCWFRSISLNTNMWKGQNFGGENTALGMNVNGNAQLLNYWNGYAGIGHNFPAYSTAALRGGDAILRPPTYNGWFGLHSDNRKRFTVGANGNWRLEEEVGGRSLRFSLNSGWRFSPSSQVSLAPFYSVNRDGWQYVGTATDGDGGKHFVFGELNQETFGMSARVNQTFTPNLSFQLYAQPFVSSGSYPLYREVRDPRAARFGERFRTFASSQVSLEDDGATIALDTDRNGSPDIRFDTPDFTVRDFKLNAVLRWEYRLGSTLFFVWSHGRSNEDDRGEFHPRRDLDVLFGEPSTNVFLIKANWWVNL
jgi:hypothetical protein